MIANLVIFVEGPSDERFLCCLLRHVDLADVHMECIKGGIAKLPRLKAIFDDHLDKGRRMVVILDADSSVERRREECQTTIAQHGLPVDAFFLMPDDMNSGCLENLLEKMAHPHHISIHDCFSQYEDCLKKLGENSGQEYHLPGIKARIFAYRDALKKKLKEKGTRAEDRDYDNAAHWNMDTPELEPLKDFLRKWAAMPLHPDTKR